MYAYRNNCDNIQLRDGNEALAYDGAGQEFTAQFNQQCNLCDGGSQTGGGGGSVDCVSTCDRDFLLNYLQRESSP